MEHKLVDPGVWAEIRRPVAPPARPALFLDRDGVINVDTGYVGDPGRVELLPWIGGIIAAANRGAVPVVVVTNQSGIGRGMYGWDAFAAVQARIYALLAREGAEIDLVIGCGYHGDGTGALRVADHPMRKPAPGMLLLAAEMAAIDLARSSLIGDRPGDVIAAHRAGLARGWHVGSTGPVPEMAAEAAAIWRNFDPARDAAGMIDRLARGAVPF